MKVGIITLVGYKNYGNRLQNYALDFLLKEQNFEVKSGLLCDVKEDWVNYSGSKIKKTAKNLYPFALYKAKKEKDLYIDDPLMEKRYKKFKSFTDKYMDTFPYICVRDSKELASAIDEPSFDYFVAGSDQVWNPYWSAHDYNFLNFTRPEKRLSFSASIGANNIPERQIPRFKKYLSQMKYISVREKDSMDLVRKLSGRNDVQYTLDPTLLLSANEWNEVSKKPYLDLKEKYICTYFLGDTPESIKELSKQIDLPIFSLNDRSMKELFILDPAEFIYMISHSTLMFTDSFHAAVFSIIYHRDFYIFRRRQDGMKDDMFVRLKSLTDTFGLQNRIINEDNFTLKDIISSTKWSEIDKQRAAEKDKSIKMLLNEMK